MDKPSREEEWAIWMRAAISGDAAAYRRFLDAVTPALRAMARRRCDQLGAPRSEAEDVVQEVLLTIHVKRGTWDATRPIGPWIAAIVRNKMIDSLRKRGRHASIPLEDVMDTLADDEPEDALAAHDLDRMLARLKESHRTIVQSLSIDGRSVRETAHRLGMSEGAVRVTLHRALKALAALSRRDMRDDG